MTEAIRETLSQCPLFAGVSPRARERLAHLAVRRRYPADQVIFVQETPPPGVFVVRRGRVRVYRLSAQGREHLLHLCEPGDSFAEVAVLGQFPLPACASAVEDTECVVLPQGPFLEALRADHELCLELLGGMSRWVHSLVGLLDDVVFRDALGRVANYLLNTAETGPDGIGQIVFRLPKREVANHLNLNGATVSRSLRRLEEAGLIENPDQRTTRIRDRAGLLRVVDEGLDPQGDDP